MVFCFLSEPIGPSSGRCRTHKRTGVFGDIDLAESECVLEQKVVVSGADGVMRLEAVYFLKQFFGIG